MKVSKVKSSEFHQGIKRVDANYYLSNGVISERKLSTSPYPLTKLHFLCNRIFNGGRYKRIYVEETSNSYELLGITEVLKSSQSGDKRISIKFTRNPESLLVKEGWILVARSGSGAIGTAAYANKDLENKIISEDLLRIEPKKETLSGYLYAFLASTYGYNLLRKGIYGTAIPHIEPDHVENIFIPILPKSKQQEIHNLIVAASNLRVEANSRLREAQGLVEKAICYKRIKVSNKVNINSIKCSHQKRFEGSHHVSEGNQIRNHIMTLNFKYLRDLSEPIFRPGIFKRHYVENGVDFLGGSDIVKAIPKSDKKLSEKKTLHLNDLKVSEDWILITCGGTIGYSVLVNKYMEGKAASQHILRIIPKGIGTGYLFAFLSSSIGLKAIQSFSYGSVIPQIEPHHIELVPVPIFPQKLMNQINGLVMEYKEMLASAIENELQAINLVEKEIESWQN